MVKLKTWFAGLADKQKKVLLYLWQAPQNLLGLAVIFFSRAWYIKDVGVWYTNHNFGVSLGNYVIVRKTCTDVTIRHERGHQKQSLLLGPLYLLVIGLPSALGNIARRAYYFDYYKQPWEAWADKLGGIVR